MSLLEVLVEVVGAVLLGLGSLLVFRVVYLADALDGPSESRQPASDASAAVDYPKAA